MKLLKRITRRLVLDQSPLDDIYNHAKQVQETVNELTKVLDIYVKGNGINNEKVSHMEHQADKIKQRIRNKLPRSDLLMPVARTDVLSFLWQQDQIADTCQDAASLLSLLRIELSKDVSAKLLKLTEYLSQTAQVYLEIVRESSELLTSSFSKEKMDELWIKIDGMNELEHSADQVETVLVKNIYEDEVMDAFQKYHLIQLVLKVGDAIDHMENAGEYLRIMTAR